MLQQFAIDWRLHRKSFFGLLASEVGAFLFGVVMTWILMTVEDNPGSWFCLGTVIAAAMVCVITVFFYSFSYGQEFQLALSMGRTRLSFLGAYVLRLVIQLLTGYGLVLLFHQIELYLYPILFRGFENDFYLAFLTQWQIILPLLLGMTALSMFIGALYAYFGKKGLWFFYLLWMFCCLVLPRMLDASAHSTGFLDRTAFRLLTFLQAIPTPLWIPLGASILLTLFAVILHLNQRQMVQ